MTDLQGAIAVFCEQIEASMPCLRHSIVSHGFPEIEQVFASQQSNCLQNPSTAGTCYFSGGKPSVAAPKEIPSQQDAAHYLDDHPSQHGRDGHLRIDPKPK